MFNLLRFAMYRSMSFELKCSVNCCLETYAGVIHFIFALDSSCLPAWRCKQNESRDCRSSVLILFQFLKVPMQ